MKTIVITGSTSGIGNAVLKEFAKGDFKIFAGYRNEAHKAKLLAISPNITPFYIDMEKEETISNAANLILDNTEKIDVLINVAGCVCAGLMENLDISAIKQQFQINTFSHLDFCQKLFKKLDGGKIINISSESSFGIYPFIAPYCASKRALDILFNSLAIETHSDIKVISIKPGAVKTPIWNKSIESNKEIFSSCSGYEKEINFLIKNAQKSEKKGIEAEKVAKLIKKVSEMKNPKPSYTIGIDAKMAEILSHLPLRIINFVVKKSLIRRLGNIS